MDKITRILRLYAQLAQGKKVNKMNFCMEVDCLERTFDRDIEDIRLYLSEFFYTQELVYDRSENVYYFTDSKRYLLEEEEYLLIERILIDSKILKTDETQEMLLHIASNTNKANLLIEHSKTQIRSNDQPVKKGITLKLFNDLQHVIDNQKTIRFLYLDTEDTVSEYEVIPYQLTYTEGALRLIGALVQQPSNKREFDLEKIDSFSITGTARKQKKI